MPKGIPLINILWTGGWDSTYRVLQLSRMNVILQPHYIVHENRRSANYELEAIAKIADDIFKDSRTQCVLMPTIITRDKDIPPNEEISNAFSAIQQHVLIGPQYEYLSRYAVNLSNLEIGIEKGGLAEEMVNQFGKMLYVEDNDVTYWQLDKTASHNALYRVFGHFRYPLYNMTKLSMKDEAEKLGVMNIMEKTWFCHFPHKGAPCGSCYPCKFTIEDGLEYRLPMSAIRRYLFEKKYQDYLFYKNYKRVRRKILKY